MNIVNYRDELNKILNQLDDKTKERKELKSLYGKCFGILMPTL